MSSKYQCTVQDVSQDASVFSCNLCSSEKARLLMTIRGFRIVKCSACGLIAVSNPPVPGELPALYGEDYYTGGNKLGYTDYLGIESSRRASFGDRLDVLSKFLPTPGTLIEIGSAYGLFLDVARERGWNTFGVEHSETSSRYARDYFNLNVVCGDLEAIPIGEPFDLAVGWDVIEHVIDPMRTLRRLNRHLRLGGMVALSTGNTACIGARLYGSTWHLYAPPWHLFYFTRTTLTAMLEKAGFEVVLVNYDGNPFYNRPVIGTLDRTLVKYLCNRWSNYFIRRLARILHSGLLFNVYARKITEFADDE